MFPIVQHMPEASGPLKQLPEFMAAIERIEAATALNVAMVELYKKRDNKLVGRIGRMVVSGNASNTPAGIAHNKALMAVLQEYARYTKTMEKQGADLIKSFTDKYGK